MSAASTAAALPARPLRRRLGRRIWAALALVAVTALTLGLLAGRDGGPSRARVTIYSSGDGAFSLAYPAGWHATALGPGAAVIQRTDRRGLVLVRERPALTGTLTSLVKNLPRELHERFPDFRPAGASVARLSTGPAVVYTFFRTKSDKVQSIVIAPAPKTHRTFTLEVVAPAKAHGAAREAGQIVRSLETR